VWEMVRMIATARITMPKAMVRLSAGRVRMTLEEQALCFLAGANSIFAGDKLLTTPNPAYVQDKEMFQVLNLKPRKAYKEALAIGS
jgi:biotin synthase